MSRVLGYGSGKEATMYDNDPDDATLAKIIADAAWNVDYHTRQLYAHRATLAAARAEQERRAHPAVSLPVLEG